MNRAQLLAHARTVVARIRRDYLTRSEKARQIRTIRRLVRWGKSS